MEESTMVTGKKQWWLTKWINQKWMLHAECPQYITYETAICHNTPTHNFTGDRKIL